MEIEHISGPPLSKEHEDLIRRTVEEIQDYYIRLVMKGIPLDQVIEEIS